MGGLLNAVTAYTHHGMDSWKRGSNCRAWLLTLYPSHVSQILCQESITTRTGSQVSSDESETCVEVEGNPMSLALFARIVEHVCWHVANKPGSFLVQNPKEGSSRDLNTQHGIQKWRSKICQTQDQIQHIRGNSQKWGSRVLQLLFFWYWECWLQTKRICLWSSRLFVSKETR